MLAFAPRYRSPWDCSQDTLTPVRLETLLLEVEATGRPTHRQTAIRGAMGLPLTNPGLERRLKELGLWPENARPLDFDIADAVWMLPRRERAAVYGLVNGLQVKEIADQLKEKAGCIYSDTRQTQQRWLRLADALGVVTLPTAEEAGAPIDMRDMRIILAYPGLSYIKTLCDTLDVWTWGGIRREDFRTVWFGAHRREECLTWHITSERAAVTDETYQMFFAKKGLASPMPEG